MLVFSSFFWFMNRTNQWEHEAPRPCCLPRARIGRGVAWPRGLELRSHTGLHQWRVRSHAAPPLLSCRGATHEWGLVNRHQGPRDYHAGTPQPAAWEEPRHLGERGPISRPVATTAIYVWAMDMRTRKERACVLRWVHRKWGKNRPRK